MPEPDADAESSEKATQDIPAKGFYQMVKKRFPAMFEAMGRVE